MSVIDTIPAITPREPHQMRGVISVNSLKLSTYEFLRTEAEKRNMKVSVFLREILDRIAEGKL